MALKNLAIGNATSTTLIGSSGGVAAVVAAMRTHADVVAVQEQGCHALHNLAISDDISTLIGSSGGVAAVVAAMRAHADVAAVQEAGCMALKNLAIGNDTNGDLIGSSGGVEAMVAAMTQHAQIQAVQDDSQFVLDLLQSVTPAGTF